MFKEAEFPDSLKDIIIQKESGMAGFPSLSSGEIHLWTASLLPSPIHTDRMRSLLSPEEKKRASYFKFEREQHAHIISQGVLRVLTASYLQIEPAEVILGASKKGKPFLVNEPRLYFNISNSHEICVYAFSRDAEVGIDLEKIRDLPDLDQLIERNLTTREKAYFLKHPDQKLSLFFQFWTYKESYLKAIGEGMRLTPENLEFSLDDGDIRLRSVNYGFESIQWYFKPFSRKGNYTGTLSYQGKNTLVREIT